MLKELKNGVWIGLLIVLVSFALLPLAFSWYQERDGQKSAVVTSVQETSSDYDYTPYAFGDDSILGIIPVSPEEGFKTGLTQYPLLTWETSKIVEDTIGVHINMEYPHFLGGTNVVKLNEYIENYLQNIVEKDRKKLEIIRSNNAWIVRDYPDSYEVSISLGALYRLIGVTNGIVSLEIVITDFTGGGNGNHDDPVTINWDLKSNRLLTADELFCSKNYIELLTPLVRAQLIKQLGTELWVSDGTTPESDWRHFLVKNDGSIAVFPPYQVSSGNSGIVRAFVPSSSVPNLLCLP